MSTAVVGGRPQAGALRAGWPSPQRLWQLIRVPGAAVLCVLEIMIAYLLVGMNAVIPFTGAPPDDVFNGLHPAAVLTTATTVFAGAVSAAGLLLMRRWPLGATIVVMAGAVFSGLVAPATILMCVVVTRAPAWRSAATATAYVAGVIAGSITPLADATGQLQFSPESAVFGGLIVRAAFTTVCVLAALLARFVWRVDALESSREEDERRLLIESAVLGERNRIAREMHDVIGHKISLIALHAGSLRLHAKSEEELASAMVIRDASADALNELRQVLAVLRGDSQGDDQRVPQPTLSDIDDLVSASAAAGVIVDYRNTVRTKLAPALSRTAYRIVQEALTNVHRHAPGTAVTIEIGQDSGSQLTISAANELPPQSPHGSRNPGGQGLVGVAERARNFGGTAKYGPTPDGMWLLTVDFPGA